MNAGQSRSTPPSRIWKPCTGRRAMMSSQLRDRLWRLLCGEGGKRHTDGGSGQRLTLRRNGGRCHLWRIETTSSTTVTTRLMILARTGFLERMTTGQCTGGCRHCRSRSVLLDLAVRNRNGDWVLRSGQLSERRRSVFDHRRKRQRCLRVDASSGALTVANSAAFSSSSSYVIDVLVERLGAVIVSDIVQLSVQYTGVIGGGNQAPTNITLSTASVTENQASGTTVGTFSTTDSDAGTRLPTR